MAKTKKAVEEPEDEPEVSPVRLKAAEGDHSGYLHIAHKGEMVRVKVEGGVTEYVSEELVEQIQAYGYRVLR